MVTMSSNDTDGRVRGGSGLDPGRQGGGPIITVTLSPAVDKLLLVKDFRVGVHARAEVRSFLPAGKGVNVARGVARMGGRAAAGGFIGRHAEQMFVESLAVEGVTSRFCVVAGQTRTNTTILDRGGRTTTHLREPGFEVDADDVDRMAALLGEWLSEVTGSPRVAFAGGLPPGMSPDQFSSLLRGCAAAGALVTVDTNGPALRAAVDSGAVDAVKPNLSEVAECLGRSVGRDEAVEAAGGLLDRVRTVLLTMGAEGAYVVTAGGALGRRCPLRRSELRNTVGCGDAFLAGWLAGRQAGESPARALSRAVAAGAASAMSETTVGYSGDDVRCLLARCEDLP